VTPKTKKNDNDAVVQAWKDYEGTVVKTRKPYEDAIKKEQTLSELGPASKALLERVNMSFSTVEIGTLVSWARAKTGLGHSSYWWYRRLMALALEGRIEAKVYRTGDKVAIMFRKKQETEG